MDSVDYISSHREGVPFLYIRIRRPVAKDIKYQPPLRLAGSKAMTGIDCGGFVTVGLS